MVLEQMQVCSSNHEIPLYPGLPTVQFDSLQYAKSQKLEALEQGYLMHIYKREFSPQVELSTPKYALVVKESMGITTSGLHDPAAYQAD